MKVKFSRPLKETPPRTPTSMLSKTTVPTVARTHQPVSACDDLHILIAKRAYELYTERGYRHGYALDDWLEAEREIFNQIPPA